MKNVMRLPAGALCFSFGLLLSGCANLWHDNPVDNRSNPDHYSYHDVSKRPTRLDEKFVRQGTQQQLSAVGAIRPEMTREQVTALLGKPLYQDDSGTQWEYDINLQLPQSENHIICQYKVIFDSITQRVKTGVWRRQQCLDLAKNVASTKETAPPSKNTLFAGAR
ncbi:outer membrane protein assembly factor BamE [Tatumella sp. JGM118]|uniref:Outer membrane protein assembly factor BamE n=1 Tax=Tatumella terrea TaxID=419007 RepID=A0ABW1VSP9_9GAMM|nr:outer membrane protein assembly factor BamE [Tatumella sp. JGM118]MBS0911110.1 outer membrane protein assembly factor BamE [Tatumella sp. JGM118]